MNECQRAISSLFNKRAAYILDYVPWYEPLQIVITGGEGERRQKLELLQWSFGECDPTENTLHSFLGSFVQASKDLV